MEERGGGRRKDGIAWGEEEEVMEKERRDGEGKGGRDETGGRRGDGEMEKEGMVSEEERGFVEHQSTLQNIPPVHFHQIC